MEYLQFSVFTKELHTRQVSGLRLKNWLTIFGTKIFPRAWQVSINQTNHPNQSKWTNSYGYSVALLQTSPVIRMLSLPRWHIRCSSMQDADIAHQGRSSGNWKQTRKLPPWMGFYSVTGKLVQVQWKIENLNLMNVLTAKTTTWVEIIFNKNLLKIGFKGLVNFGVEFTLVHVPSHPNS